MALNSLDFFLDFSSMTHLHVQAMSIFSDKTVAKELHLRPRILRWLSASAYFVLLGTGGLHAGEAKPSSPVEWERTVEAAKKGRKHIPERWVRRLAASMSIPNG